MNRNVVKIEKNFAAMPTFKKVAAYARVSSEKDAMLHSLAAQVSYYSGLIQRNPGWFYSGVYADEALTGTKDNRPEFMRMIADCKAGKIDMIMTKSISRFARNTVTLLETVRELKLLGVDVFFEEQNIHSINNDGELMLTVLAGYLQEESLSVSENCKWRIRMQFKQGELACLRFMYGYQIVKSKVEIDPNQAAIVCMIFSDYIAGMGGHSIAKKLREMNIPKVLGGKWTSERVIDILKNEKYVGDALLQKKYVIDHLTKKLVRNKGKLLTFYASDTHPAIIDSETFEKAKSVMEQRCNHFAAKTDTLSRYPFSGMIKCGKCGKSYKRKVRAGKPSWQCSTYLKEGKSVCFAQQIPESVLISLSAEVLNLVDFDAGIFQSKIAEIKVTDSYKLIFLFEDGRTSEMMWNHNSRSENWTSEKRNLASEIAKRRRSNWHQVLE